MDRRSFLKLSATLSSSVVVSTHLSGCSSTPDELPNEPVEFTHSVASGDPTQSSVILWTRAQPIESRSASVVWQVASSPSFSRIIRSGIATAKSQNDYIIKVDVQDLPSDSRFYFRFITAHGSSRVGQTMTLPQGNVDKVKLAVFSCANYPAGYFNAYADAATHKDIDVVIHLGDYIYEYSSTGYATEHAQEIGRTYNQDNLGELFTLDDYRKRYNITRLDQGLLSLHEKKPFIAVWDDHEIANDTYREGAQNHSADEGDFYARRAAAVQAYYEWLPIRPPRGDASLYTYRRFDFGNLLSLHMLDTRVIGRDKQLAIADFMDANTGQLDRAALERALMDKKRSLLGKEQYNWLASQLMTSDARWQLLGQQVLMGKMHYPAEVFATPNKQDVPGTVRALVRLKQQAEEGIALTLQEQARLDNTMAYNLDAWDGYPAEREAIYKVCQNLKKSLLVIAGDTHNGWCNALTNNKGEQVGIEFATSSVSSPGMEHFLGISDQQAMALAQDIPKLVEDVDYCNLHQRGYLTLDINRGLVTAKWHYTNTVMSRDFSVVTDFTKQYTD